MSFESPIQPRPVQEKPEPVVEKLETGKKVFEFLDRTKFLDVRKSDEQFDEWLQKLFYEDYVNYLTRLNGILREVPIKKREVDGSGVELSAGALFGISYLPPATEQKDGLMRESFEAIKQMPDNEDRALLIYYAIQAIHPYSDGNGRTRRLLHEIISEDGKGLTEERLSELLDHDKQGSSGSGKGRDSFAEKVLDPNSAYDYINREVAREILGEDFLKEHGSIFDAAMAGEGFVPVAVKEKLLQEEVVLAEKILGESEVNNFSFRGLVMAKLLREKGDLQKYPFTLNNPIIDGQRRGITPEDTGKKIFSFEGDKLMEDLTVEDVRRLIEIHKEIKSKFVKTMVDIFANPENHQITNKEGEIVPIKTTFRK